MHVGCAFVQQCDNVQPILLEFFACSCVFNVFASNSSCQWSSKHRCSADCINAFYFPFA